MNTPFFKRLLASLASDDPVPQESTRAAKEARIAEVSTALRHHNIAHNDSSYGEKLGIALDLGKYYFPVQYDGDRLTLTTGWHGQNAELPIANTEQLLAFVRAVQERIEIEAGQQQRRDKLRKLRVRAMRAAVEPIAEKMGFVFAFQEMVPKVKLAVLLSKDVGLEIDLPYKGFEKRLADLPLLVKTMRELTAKGLAFKLIGAKEIRYHYKFPTT